MQENQVCPFFRKDDDYCDVGCGYISPHDVQMMVAYCNCRFSECIKFQELATRYPRVAAKRMEPVLDTPTALPPRSPGTPERIDNIPNQKPLVRPFKVKWPLPFHVRFISTNNYENPIPYKEAQSMTSDNVRNRGWTVALAGTGINLALGILYTWSIFKGEITESIARGGEGAFAWNAASINDPYALACLVFAFTMIVAGKCQDKFGPRLTIMIGGLLVGAGFLLVSQSTEYWIWVLGFGLMAGMGIGFGYSAATPPALKWFPPAKTGLIAGIVVSGFGLASVYIAPLASYLLGAYGLQKSMLFFGLAFTVVVCGFALLVSNPPKGYVPPVVDTKGGAKKAVAQVDLSPSQLFSNGKFYTLWVAFFIGAGAGLMVIGSVAGMAKQSLGEMAFLAVAIMAVGNAAGRIVAGVVSDKIGRANTLIIMLAFQALLMFAAIPVMGSGSSNALILVVLATFIGFNYGTNLALFPAFAKDLWGLKNFGMNYGLLFSAWGIGAFVLVRLAEMLKVQYGSFTPSFGVAGILLLVGAMLCTSLRERKAEAPQEALVPVAVEEEDLVLEEGKG
jgi:MFS transporter, OFA family, oxalate/formate antiporter